MNTDQIVQIAQSDQCDFYFAYAHKVSPCIAKYITRKPVLGGLPTTRPDCMDAQAGLRPCYLFIGMFESIISRLAMTEISMSQLASADEQAGLNLTLSKTPKIGFLTSRPIYFSNETESNYVLF